MIVMMKMMNARTIFIIAITCTKIAMSKKSKDKVVELVVVVVVVVVVISYDMSYVLYCCAVAHCGLNE